MVRPTGAPSAHVQWTGAPGAGARGAGAPGADTRGAGAPGAGAPSVGARGAVPDIFGGFFLAFFFTTRICDSTATLVVTAGETS